MYLTGRRILLAAALLGAAVLAGCSTASISPAPVEDRDTRSVARVDPASLPGFENAGKPGYYTVRPGDTIMRIATEVNHPWRDIARWNNLDNPNVIEVGQVLRVTPPTGAAPGATTPITATPLPAPAPAASNSAKPPAAQAPVPVATQTTPPASAPA
ncbi:MAG TPA: LysM peptidoglycan-binding domain-containing protein, partial [Ottowia sp.]|nr:LysM peptidoglycan-binding domain-containing protein [Ottowia sp.]